MNRHHLNTVFCLSCKAALSTCFLVLIFFLARITWNGISTIDFGFLFSPSKNFGMEGGIFYQITGTLLMVAFAGMLSLTLALGTALFQSEYLENRFLQKALKMLIYGLNGIPSILFGIFGLIFFVIILSMGISWFVGAMVLAMMILPTVILSTYQSINSIPESYRETALALGFNKWELIMKVLIPQGFGGATTGLLLGMGRAAGETAPIMFVATAFSGVEFPYSFAEPVSTLPTHILALAQQASNPQALENAWGASFVLLFIVMILNGSALYSRIKFKTASFR